MVISEKIEVEDKIVANGGFADVRIGRCAGSFVAVKTLRAAETDDLQKLKKVSIIITTLDITIELNGSALAVL